MRQWSRLILAIGLLACGGSHAEAPSPTAQYGSMSPQEPTTITAGAGADAPPPPPAPVALAPERDRRGEAEKSEGGKEGGAAPGKQDFRSKPGDLSTPLAQNVPAPGQPPKGKDSSRRAPETASDIAAVR